jgi:hypothetical protein
MPISEVFPGYLQGKVIVVSTIKYMKSRVKHRARSIKKKDKWRF